MNKKLTARVQKLNPAIKEQEKSFSFGISIEPEGKDISLSKGSIYAIFDISSENSLDTSVVSKAIQDVLADTYYSVESVSPVQSLERALSKVRDSVIELQEGSSIVDSEITFNALISVLWGNVLYVVKYGTGSGYLMRGNEIKPIQASGEGNYASASGVVREDDVVILCTESFEKRYPPQVLLTMAMSEKDLSKKDSCLLLKFIVDTSFTEAEVKEMSAVSITKHSKMENVVDNIITKLQTFNPSKTTSSSLVVAKPKITLKKGISLDRRYVIGAISFVITLLVALGVYSLFTSRKESLVKETVSDQVAVPGTEPTAVSMEDFSKDKELGITRANVENTLFDLVITSTTIEPSEIELYGNKLLVADPTSGKVYTSILGDYKFLPIEETYPGIHNLVVAEAGDLFFTDTKGINKYSISDLSLLKTYSAVSFGGLGLFGRYIYTFDGDKLIRYADEDGSLVPTTWGESEEFSNAKGIQIAYSVYVVTSDNTISKYTTGSKDSFEVTGLTTPFGNIVDFVAKEDFNHIYVADKTNNRVVVLDLKGNFVKQYKYSDSVEWNNIKSIAVDDSEKTLYVLSGTKIFEIAL